MTRALFLSLALIVNLLPVLVYKLALMVERVLN